MWLEPIREAFALARQRAAPVFSFDRSVACILSCETRLAPDVHDAFAKALELSILFADGRHSA
jgi:hypothetical protein